MELTSSDRNIGNEGPKENMGILRKEELEQNPPGLEKPTLVLSKTPHLMPSDAQGTKPTTSLPRGGDTGCDTASV